MIKKIFVLLVSLFCSLSAFAAPDGYISIKTAKEFKEEISKNTSGKFYLENDIDLSEYMNWKPLSFRGILDGNNKTISNLRAVNESSESNGMGLFYDSYDATIKDLTLQDGLVVGETYIGSLVGYAQNTKIINVKSNVSVKSLKRSAGGLVGHLGSNSLIKNSLSMGNVVGKSFVGGIVGHLKNSTIMQSFSTGNVKGGTFTGGFVGKANNGQIVNSFSTGNATILNQSILSGALVGGCEYGVIKNSYASGTVATGKLVGKIDDLTMVTNSYTKDGAYKNWDFDKIWAKSQDNPPCLRKLTDPYTGNICGAN